MRTHTLYYIALAWCLLLPANNAYAQSPSRGDVNGDGKVDIEDVTTLVDYYLLKKNQPEEKELQVVNVSSAPMHNGYVEFTATTATFSGYFKDNGKVGYGVAVSEEKNKDVTQWQRTYSNNSENGIFGVKVNKLKPNTVYYYRFFTSTDSTICFAALNKFKTSSLQLTFKELDNIKCCWTEAFIQSNHDCKTDTDETGIAYRLTEPSSNSQWNYQKSSVYYSETYSTHIQQLLPDSEYDIRQYVICGTDTIYGKTYQMQTKGFETNGEPVDLGLSVQWASTNLGAEKPEDRGLFYAWGETKGYTTGERYFRWQTYTLCQGTQNSILKYCMNADMGEIDRLEVLLPEDDAATVALGSEWRMPTDAEFTELRTQCTWTWTSLHGTNGYVVNNNNAAIFLPVTGFHQKKINTEYGGFYWTSSVLSNGYQAWRIQFYETRVTRFRDNRYYGECIRPVKE